MRPLQRPGTERRTRREAALLLAAALVAVGVFTASGAAVSSGTTSARGGVGSAAVPASTSPPVVTGIPTQDEYLTADRGSWNGAPSEFDHQWQRCNASGGDCVDLAGAVGHAYRASLGDIGRRLRVRVTATNADGPGTAFSEPTPAIAQAKPVNVSLPSISGARVEGDALKASPGWWVSASPIGFTYQWVRCPRVFEFSKCSPIGRATSTTYSLGAADVGRTLFVQVRARNDAGPSFVNSLPTGVVAGSGVVAPPAGVVAVARVSLPNRLVISKTSFTPASVTRYGQSLTLRARITEAEGKPVHGALVHATGVPFDRLTPAPEARTDEDGWATFAFRTRATFALTPDGVVVLFVRARKPGDSVLAGVSTRRLVSVRIE